MTFFVLHSILAQTELAALEPNWPMIGALIALFVLLALFLAWPTKKALPSEKTDATAKLTDDSSSEAEKDKQKSLSEIKEAKRSALPADVSADEKRELRKERRAAQQTDKAIQKREQAAEDAKASAQEEAPSEPEELAKAPEEEVASAEMSDVGAFDETLDNEVLQIDLAELNSVVTQTETDTGDVFASLFGNPKAEIDLSLDDELEAAAIEPKASIPTLGSALIPLTAFADNKADEQDTALPPIDELTQRLTAKAEKKTLI